MKCCSRGAAGAPPAAPAARAREAASAGVAWGVSSMMQQQHWRQGAQASRTAVWWLRRPVTAVGSLGRRGSGT